MLLITEFRRNYCQNSLRDHGGIVADFIKITFIIWEYVVDKKRGPSRRCRDGLI